MSDFDASSLKVAAEGLASSLGPSGAVLLGSSSGGKVSLVAVFGDGVVEAGCTAGKTVAAAARACGGGGGGRPNFAQAGGKDAGALDAALDAAREELVASLSS